MGGSEKSGTPLETRGAANAAGLSIMDLFQGNQPITPTGATASPLQRLGTQAQQNLLSTQLGGQDLRSILGGALATPQDQTAGLFAAMQPFEARETERQVGGLRSSMGSLGGRFSRNLLSAETGLRGRLSEGFGRSREQALLQAQGQQNQAIDAIMRNLLGAQQVGNQQTGQALQFAAPGGAVIEQGMLPGLLQAGSQLGAAAILSSDRDLKEGIEYISELLATWKWNRKAEEVFGLAGRAVGFIAQDIQKIRPEAVVTVDGFLHIDYAKLLRS